MQDVQDEEMQVVTLHDYFYRDSFKTVLGIIFGSLLLVCALVGLAVYYYRLKPLPVVFAVMPRWQVQAPVNVIKPFVSNADLLQWVSEVVPALFSVDFLNYDDQVAAQMKNFTANGWRVYQNQLKNFAPKDTMSSDRTFISARPTDAPAIINRGILSGRYAWVMTVPLDIQYVNLLKAKQEKKITFQVMVVRVPTEKNLVGIAIDDIVVAKNA